MPEVELKPIPGLDGYLASKDGSVWSCIRSTPKKLKPDKKVSDGRNRFTIRVASGKYRKFTAAELVLLTYVCPRPIGLEACHNNGNCLDDSVGNLRWDTHSSNLLDRRTHGTSVCGEKHPRAKITEEDVREIRRRAACKECSNTELAEEYGISGAMVGYIIKKKSWSHVK